MKDRTDLSRANTLHILLIMVTLGIMGFTGWYVVRAKANINATYASAKKVSEANKPNHVKKPAVATAPVTTTPVITNTDSSKKADPAPVFNFVDTSDWVQKQSSDGSYSIKYNKYNLYGVCTDVPASLLIALSFGGDGTFDCNGLEGAVSLEPYGDNSVRLLTQLAIGQGDALWDKGAAKPITVTLPNGEAAKRYQYSHEFGGDNYETIEYDTTYQSKNYVAVFNWRDSDGNNISTDAFDTIIQKTWLFN